MPCDYSNCVIYKIYCKDASNSDVYVGHTTNFKSRQAVHKAKSNMDKGYNVRIYSIIKGNGGFKNYDMEVIEKYPCANKIEAIQREQYWYEILNPSLNQLLPYISAEDIKAKRTEYNKQYFKDHQDYFSNYHKEYYSKYPEKKIAIARKYYLKNRDKISQKNKEERLVCECGVDIRRADKTKHIKSKYHINFLSNNNIENVPNEP
jgi:predicted GIY-YIG superfamily endonuclease